jgi:hypothetical protein
MPEVLPVRLSHATEVVVAVAEAPSEDAATKSLLRLIVPLGPWAERLMFDVNLGAVRLEDRDFTFSGDALLGYNGTHFGVAGRGALYEYDFTSDQRVIQTTQAEGGLDGWWVLGERGLRFELRAEGGVAYLDTTRISTAPGDTVFSDETSVMGRGLLFAAARYEPNDRLAMGLWLGGGAQYENYTPLSQPRAGVVSLSDETAVTAIAQARLRVQISVVPRWLTVRLRGDAHRYEIRRDRDLFTLTSGGNVSGSTAEKTVQFEAHGRLFLDADLARAAGFVPGLFAGVDHFGVETDSGVTNFATTPVFGGGIRRVAF